MFKAIQSGIQNRKGIDMAHKSVKRLAHCGCLEKMTRLCDCSLESFVHVGGGLLLWTLYIIDRFAG